MPQSLTQAIYNSNLNRASHNKRYLTKIAENQGQALYQVADQLDGKVTTVFPDRGPYETALSTSIYDVPNEGMGDTSFWSQVGTTFASQIGAGLSARIGGSQNPTPAAPQLNVDEIVARVKAANTPPTPTPVAFPTWAKVAIAGVGVLGLLYIVKRA